MDDNRYLTAVAIGQAAYEILQTETGAKVWGNTSKGVFVVSRHTPLTFSKPDRVRSICPGNQDQPANTRLDSYDPK